MSQQSVSPHFLVCPASTAAWEGQLIVLMGVLSGSGLSLLFCQPYLLPERVMATQRKGKKGSSMFVDPELRGLYRNMVPRCYFKLVTLKKNTEVCDLTLPFSINKYLLTY